MKSALFDKVPPICHFYWDKSPMSYLQYLTIVSFNFFHPEYEIIIHTPKRPSARQKTWGTGEQNINYTGFNFWGRLQNLDYVRVIEHDLAQYEIREDLHEVQKSDILRWKLLYEFGGVWSDVDILYIGRMTDKLTEVVKSQLRHPNETFASLDRVHQAKPFGQIKTALNPDSDHLKLRPVNNTVCCRSDYGHIIGFFMAAKHSQFFDILYKLCLDVCNSDALPENNYQSFGSLLLNKHLGYFAKGSQLINEGKTPCQSGQCGECSRCGRNWNDDFDRPNIENQVIYNVGIEAICPFEWTEIFQIYKSEWEPDRLSPNTVGIHWYNGAEVSKIFANNFNRDFILRSDDLKISKIIREIGIE